jgi:hypothetical protein
MPSATEILNRVFNSTSNTLATGGFSSSATVGNGRKVIATAGTAEALATSTACSSVVITAETDNTGVIVVGASDVIAALATRKGTPLNAGDSIALDIDNLSKIYLDTTVNGDGVTYTYTA